MSNNTGSAIADALLNAFDVAESEAQLDEGLRPLTTEEQLLLEKHRELVEAKKVLDAKLKDLRETFGATLVADNLQGLTYGGKVVARLSNVTSHTIDTAKIKKESPELFGELFTTYGKTTVTERVTIK